MTNRQLNFENIDKVENLNYTPLEKKYLKVQTGMSTELCHA